MSLQVHKRTTCPEFDEDFVFDVSSDELCSRTLEVLVYDATPASSSSVPGGRGGNATATPGGRGGDAAGDECTGQLLLPLDDVDLATADTVWLCKGISPHVKKNEVSTPLTRFAPL